MGVPTWAGSSFFKKKKNLITSSLDSGTRDVCSEQDNQEVHYKAPPV